MTHAATGRTSSGRDGARAVTGPASGPQGLLRFCRENPVASWSLFALVVPAALAAFVAAQNPAPYGRDGEFWRVWAMFSVNIGVPWVITAGVTWLLDRLTPLGRGPLIALLACGALAALLINRAALSTLVPIVEPWIIGPLAAERPLVVVPAVPPDFSSLVDTFRVNFIWIVIWVGLVFVLDRGFGIRLFQLGRASGFVAAAEVGVSQPINPHPVRAAEGLAPPRHLPKPSDIGDFESIGSPSLFLERCRTVGKRLEDVILVKAEDHYLRVYGREAHELVLFRMSDAMRELASVEGAQVHRSYWVARKAVRGFVLDNGQYELALLGGMRVPVSRTFIERARAAGLLENRLFL